MKKRTPAESLKSFSFVYIVLAGILVIAALVCNFVPDIANAIKSIPDQPNIMLVSNITAVVNVLVYLWYFWLTRRVADGKSNGTLLMVLLILGVVSKIVTLIMTRSVTSITNLDFIADAFGLYLLLKVRKS